MALQENEKYSLSAEDIEIFKFIDKSLKSYDASLFFSNFEICLNRDNILDFFNSCIDNQLIILNINKFFISHPELLITLMSNALEYAGISKNKENGNLISTFPVLREMTQRNNSRYFIPPGLSSTLFKIKQEKEYGILIDLNKYFIQNETFFYRNEKFAYSFTDAQFRILFGYTNYKKIPDLNVLHIRRENKAAFIHILTHKFTNKTYICKDRRDSCDMYNILRIFNIPGKPSDFNIKTKIVFLICGFHRKAHSGIINTINNIYLVNKKIKDASKSKGICHKKHKKHNYQKRVSNIFLDELNKPTTAKEYATSKNISIQYAYRKLNKIHLKRKQMLLENKGAIENLDWLL